MQDFKDVFNLRMGIRFLANFAIAIQMIVSKVENILKGILDSIPSPSPSFKIQIIGGKVCLRCKAETYILTECSKQFK